MPDIEIKGINVLRGANIWAHQPVIEALVDIGPYEERPSDKIPGFTERLFEALPSLITHRCSEGKPGGLLIRMREGTWMGHIMEHVALELQCLAGMEVSYGKTRSEGDDFRGQYRVVIEYQEARAGRMAIEVAAEGCEALACDESYDFTPAIRELRETGEYRMLNPTLRALRDAARGRGIPWIRLDGKNSLQLGYGKRAVKIVDGTIEDRSLTLKDGQTLEYYEAIIEELFPGEENGRIPITAITGTNGKTTVTRMIGHIMREAGNYVGMTTTDGIYLDGKLSFEGDCSGPQSADEVLTNADVEVAVLETARGGILRSGLAFDVCDVGVVLNVTADHIGLGGIHSLEDLAFAKGVVIESVRRSGFGVLNAEDALSAELAEYCDGGVIFFSRNPQNARLKKHAKAGGIAITVVDGWLQLSEKSNKTQIVKVEDVPATLGGSIGFQIDNALAAAAAAWGAGVAPEVIGRALGTFDANADMTPGRFNVFEGSDYTLVVDFAHNPASMMALRDALKGYTATRQYKRIVGAVGAPGDRRDREIRDVAAIAAGMFDLLIVRDDDDLRGREPGEVPRIMAEEARKTLPGDKVIEVVGEFPTLAKALETTRPGDLTVICAVQIPRTLQEIRAHLASAG